MLRDLCGDVGMLVYWCMSILNANENEILNKGRESKKYGESYLYEKEGVTLSYD